MATKVCCYVVENWMLSYSIHSLLKSPIMSRAISPLYQWFLNVGAPIPHGCMGSKWQKCWTRALNGDRIFYVYVTAADLLYDVSSF